MTDPNEDRFFESLAGAEPPEEAPAPSRLKSKIYSALLEAQQESGPLSSLSGSRANGHALCVFERIVEGSPVSRSVKTINFCTVCHARVLGERVENAPIWWPHCPYVGFQNR